MVGSRTGRLTCAGTDDRPREELQEADGMTGGNPTPGMEEWAARIKDLAVSETDRREITANEGTPNGTLGMDPGMGPRMDTA